MAIERIMPALGLKNPHWAVMTLRLRADISDEERHATWIRVVERIYNEQVNQAWSHYMFRLLRAVFVKNKRLADGG